jgi:hypothetical protein
VWQQRAIEIHNEESDWERRFHRHDALPTPTNFGHAVATREVAANGHAPTDAEAIGETRNVVTLTVTEFKECGATWAQQARQLGDKSANQFQPITAAIECEAWLCGNAEARQVAWGKVANASGGLRRINIRGWHIRQVGDQEIEVRWIAGCTRGEERLRKIALHEGDARRNATTQRSRARHHQRIARDVGGNETQGHWRFVGERHGECATTGADLGGVEWMGRTTECAVGGNAVGEEGECRLNDQFALWSRVQHVRRDEQL